MYSRHAPVCKLMCHSLAYAEMRLLLAKMLWHFDFELEDPEKDWYGSLRVFMVWEREPLRIRLRAVER
jgi:cytochrome P450